ncbi:ATP-binding protein [Dactylosporangium sp. NPDC049525]|uniref:ATP-binding protein n=1 Tax=Dactylosporangium sp. NPDC049525 TaxID=3154730 RepID=UPI003442C188
MPTAEELYTQLQAFQAADRAARLNRFDDATLAWLALPPLWTVRLAAAAGLPGWHDALLSELEELRICQRAAAPKLHRPEWYAVEIDVRLAAFLPPAEHHQIATRVAAVDDVPTRVRLLTLLVPYVSPALLTNLRDLAAAVPDPSDRARALTALVPHLPAGAATAALQQAHDAAAEVEDPGGQVEALLLVAPLMAHLEMTAAAHAILRLAAMLTHEAERSRVLTRVAPYLPDSLVPEAVVTATAISAPDCRARPLAALAGRLPLDAALAVLDRELAAAAAQAWDEDTDAALRTLVRTLAVLEPAGATASERLLVAIDHAARRQPELAVFLAARAPVARDTTAGAGPVRSAGTVVAAAMTSGPKADELATEALKHLADVEDPAERVALCRKLLAAPLSADMRQITADVAVHSARSIADLGDRIDALVDLVEYLPDSLRDRVVAEARAQVAHGAQDVSFWVPEATRLDILQRIAGGPGQRFLYEVTAAIAQRLTDVSAATPLNQALERWRKLAATGTSATAEANATAVSLDIYIHTLVGRRASEQALAWLDTARLLVPVFGAQLESVVTLGTRRVELLHRQTLDRRQLRTFLRRDGQVEQFHALLDDSAHWALHYLGVGGAGKTMLLRHLTAVVASDLSVPTARIDFDHINPDYPIRKPGQLFLDLMDELQPFAVSDRYALQASRLRAAVARLHEFGGEPTPADPLAGRREETFQEALRAFASFLGSLHQPVVLILDTCEELAKVHSAGARVAPVDATFAIIEQLHAVLPTLRVVFAGRRFLARSGAGWQAPEPSDRLAPHKDYLRLYEVRGFDDDEARRFLSPAAMPGRTLDEDLTAAILRRSTEAAVEERVTWTPPRPGDRSARYNPFDLNLYRTWLRDEPGLTAAALDAETSDPYVTVRIVRRLRRHDVQRLLPAVALLGRFDRAMLRPAHVGDDESFGEAFLELAQQEWIEFQRGESAFLQVNRNLLARLREYCAAPEHRAERDASQSLLAAGLADLVRRRDPDDIGVDLLDAALRLLPPAEASALWDDVARRTRLASNWTWAEQRTARLLGEDGAVAGLDHPARAAVRAAWIAAVCHTRSGLDLSAEWQEVAERAGQHPDPVMRAWLADRATAGQIAGGGMAPDDAWRALRDLLSTFPARLGRMARDLVDQLAGSYCAAVEATVESAEERGDPLPAQYADAVAGWIECLRTANMAELAAFADSLHLRALVVLGRHDEAARVATALCSTGVLDGPLPAGSHWADWPAPVHLRPRIRLELVRWAVEERTLATPQVLDPDALDEWFLDAMGNLPDVDADRLASAVVAFLHGRSDLRDQVRDLVAAWHANAPTRPPMPQRHCHRTVPPLFVTLAHVTADIGDFAGALTLLAAGRRVALTHGDQHTARAAAIAELVIRRRLRRPAGSLGQSAVLALPAGRLAGWALTALCEPAAVPLPMPAEGMQRADVHAWWRCHRRWTRSVVPATVLELLRQEQDVLALSPLRLDDLHLALDRLERNRLVGSPPSADDRVLDLRRLAHDPHATASEQFRLLLRIAALGPGWSVLPPDADDVSSPGPAGEFLERWAPRLGRRRMADLAADEGELLGLRLPTEATILLQLAIAWYDAAGDPIGGLFACTRFALTAVRGGRVKPDVAARLLGELADRERSVAAVVPGPDARQREHAGDLDVLAGTGWRSRLDTARQWLATVASGGAFRLTARTPAELKLPMPVGSPWTLRGERVLTAEQRVTVFTVSGLVAAALLFWALYRADRTLEPVFGVYLALFLTVAAGAVVLACVAVLIGVVTGHWYQNTAFRRDLERWRWSGGDTVVHVQHDSATVGGQKRLHLEVLQRSNGFLHFLGYGWSRPSEYTVPLPHLGPYAEAATGIPAQIRAMFEETAEMATPTVRLDIAPDLHHLPWENLLLAGSSSAAQVRFWRQCHPSFPVAEHEGAEPAPRAKRGVRILADSGVQLFAELAWDGKFPILAAPDAAAAGGPVAAPTVLHVIGRAVRTGGTIGLQISQSAMLDLIEPRDICAVGAPIVIIQDLPTSAEVSPEAARQATADLRTFAVETCADRVSTVVVVPSLPPRGANAAADRLVAGLRGVTDIERRHGVELRALLEAAGQIRNGTAPNWPENSPEIAGEVCIFHRPLDNT